MLLKVTACALQKWSNKGTINAVSTVDKIVDRPSGPYIAPVNLFWPLLIAVLVRLTIIYLFLEVLFYFYIFPPAQKSVL